MLAGPFKMKRTCYKTRGMVPASASNGPLGLMLTEYTMDLLRKTAAMKD